MEFNTLNDLYGYLDKNLKSTLKNEFKDYAIDVMKKQMKHHVYDAGHPSLGKYGYKRMYENGGLLGSLGDRQSYGTADFIEIGSLPYNMKTHYSLMPYYEPRYSTGFLNEIVVEGLSGSYCGDGYWRKPRDYVTPARREIFSHASNKMAEFMANKGIKLTH